MSTNNATADVIERLETKLAFLESANADLSDVVYRQQREIDALRDRLSVLNSSVEELRNKPTEWTPAQEKPPHF